jgi:adenylate cyclase
MAGNTDIGKPSVAWSQAPPTWWTRLADRHPLVGLLVVVLLPNIIWSAANLGYNARLIVDKCTQAQSDAFWRYGFTIYPTVSWLVGLAVYAWLIRPIIAYCRAQDGKRTLTGAFKQVAQRRVVNLPWYQLWINAFLWLPGGVVFPAIIIGIGGHERWLEITVQFLLSFGVSALVTTFQTFVLLERFLMMYVYPRVFTDVRPVDVDGAVLLTFPWRMRLLWLAVSVGPLVVLVLITANLLTWDHPLLLLTGEIVAFGVLTGWWITSVVGKDLSTWLDTHMDATREVARENFDVRIARLRSDEWGRLTDSFNQMAQDLSRGRQVNETLGQFVGAEVREEILRRFPGLGGSVEEITVMFADIRGFTQRSAGQPPVEVVDLLNRFLSLAVEAVANQGGWVNKFLGDGFMALFGAPLARSDHADRAVAAALDLLARLGELNRDLKSRGEAPLRIGIGIHSGPALVGCIGATIRSGGGRQQVRKELTAIGETVNLAQRMEEATKTCGAMLLISDATRLLLQRPLPLVCAGPQTIRGASEPIVAYTYSK